MAAESNLTARDFPIDTEGTAAQSSLPSRDKQIAGITGSSTVFVILQPHTTILT